MMHSEEFVKFFLLSMLTGMKHVCCARLATYGCSGSSNYSKCWFVLMITLFYIGYFYIVFSFIFLNKIVANERSPTSVYVKKYDKTSFVKCIDSITREVIQDVKLSFSA